MAFWPSLGLDLDENDGQKKKSMLNATLTDLDEVEEPGLVLDRDGARWWKKRKSEAAGVRLAGWRPVLVRLHCGSG